MHRSRPGTPRRARLTPWGVLFGLLGGLVAVVLPVAGPTAPAQAASAGVMDAVAPATCEPDYVAFYTCSPIYVRYRVDVNGALADDARPIRVGDVVDVKVEVPATVAPFLAATDDRFWPSSNLADQFLRVGYRGPAGVFGTPRVVRMERVDLGDRGSGPGVNCALQSGDEPARAAVATNLVFGAAPVTTAGLKAVRSGTIVQGVFADTAVDRCSGVLSRNAISPGYAMTVRQTVVALPVGTTKVAWDISGLGWGGVGAADPTASARLMWGGGAVVSAPILERAGAPTITSVVNTGTGTSAALNVTYPTDRSRVTAWDVVPYVNGVAQPAVRVPDDDTGFVVVSGLTKGVDHQFTAAAVGEWGVGVASARSTAIRVFAPPGQPSGLTVFPEPGGAYLSWAVPDDGGSPVQRSRVDVVGATAPTTTGGARTATVSGLTNGTRVRFDVALDNGLRGTAARSEEVMIGRPLAPSDLTVVPSRDGATLDWVTPSSGGAGVTGASITVRNTAGAVVRVTELQFLGTPDQPGAGRTTTLTGLTRGSAYTATVTLRNADGYGLPSPARSFTAGTVPAAPGSLTAVPGSEPATLDLSWAADPQDVGSVSRAEITYTTVEGSRSISTDAFGTTVVVPGAGSYTFSVKLCNAIGCGPAATTTATAYDAPSEPGPPTVTAAPGSSHDISWTAPVSTGGRPLQSYMVRIYSGDTLVLERYVFWSSLSTRVSGLAPGTYEVQVRARHELYVGLFSELTSFTVAGPQSPPGPPTSVSARAGVGSATVRWAAPASDGGGAITGYRIQPSVGGAQLPPVVMPAAARSCSFDDLVPGQAYSFEVKALSNAGPGSPASAGPVTPTRATGAPGAPTIRTATAADGEVVVRWSAPTSTGGGPVTGYLVTATAPSANQAITRRFDDPSTSQVFAPLANGFAYTFRVAAINDSGVSRSSAASAEVTPDDGLSVPGAPTVGTVSAGDTTATVRWTAPESDGGYPVTSYRVTPVVDGVPQPAFTFPASARSGKITALTNGTTYRFTVAAANVLGLGAPSEPSAAVTPRPAAPGAPTSVTAEAYNSIALVSWTAPASAGGSPITGYQVTPYVGTRAKPAVTFTSTETTQALRGLDNGVAYTFRVRAINAGGAGALSAASAPVTPAPASGTPAAPTVTSQTPLDGAVRLTWTPPADTGGMPITSYRVIPYANGVVQQYFEFSGTGTTQTVTNLTNGVSYRFKVAAVNANGYGADSALTSPVVPGAP